jgi:DNA-binding transcriptional ArsR family regulator
MSLSDEKRKEILQLLADGKINADEAAEMLSTRSEEDVVAEQAAPPTPKFSESPAAAPEKTVKNGQSPQWLHIRVGDLETGKSKVTVNIPLRMVKFGLQMGRRFAPELEGFDWNDLSRVMTEESGVLVDVQDAEDGEHVQIYVD